MDNIVKINDKSVFYGNIVTKITEDDVVFDDRDFGNYPQFDIDCDYCGFGDTLTRRDFIYNKRQAVERFSQDGWCVERIHIPEDERLVYRIRCGECSKKVLTDK